MDPTSAKIDGGKHEHGPTPVSGARCDTREVVSALRRRLIFIALLSAGLVLAFVARELLTGNDNDVGRVRVLPDGSTLRLERVVFTSQGFTYSFAQGGRIVRWMLSKLPVSLRKRLKLPGGGVAYGGSVADNTNLLVVTTNRRSGGSGTVKSYSWVGRLRVCDEYGNRSDECCSGPPFGPPGVIGQLWVISAFPRRSRLLTLECLTTNAEGGWRNIAQFRVPNPAWADSPPWSPEKLPATSEDRGLAVTLEAFQTGWRMPPPGGLGDAATAARKTRLVFSLAENGKPCSDWVPKRLTFSKATGNNWSVSVDAAYLDPGRCVLEFYRPLWPGERGWKVRAEFLRVIQSRSEERDVDFLAQPELVDDVPGKSVERRELRDVPAH